MQSAKNPNVWFFLNEGKEEGKKVKGVDQEPESMQLRRQKSHKSIKTSHNIIIIFLFSGKFFFLFYFI